ncbi:MAG: hypothetical protein H6689_00715 [Erysipelotrichaceae bacterium]|nr:hypothetical protein [Erysipelotrichaceae bacterium]
MIVITERFSYDQETNLIVEKGKYEIIVDRGALYIDMLLDVKNKIMDIYLFSSRNILDDSITFSLGSTISGIDNGDTITLNADGTGYVHCVK